MEQNQLIERARRGEADAWEALVREYQQPVFRLAYLMLADAAEAEDVAQEAFIRAWRALHRFDDSRPLRPWLLRITANLTRNRRRALGRYWMALKRWRDESANEEIIGMEAMTLEISQAKTLWRAIGQLHQTDQEVIYLRYFLDLTQVEAAETLAVPTGTIKSRQYRALRRLRRVIEREYPDLGDMSA